jgi:hypothetical protein
MELKYRTGFSLEYTLYSFSVCVVAAIPIQKGHNILSLNAKR